MGGLVFEELTRPYLGAWGDWARRAPPRLLVAIDREPDEAGAEPKRIVLLSSVLPDAANLGYQELRDLIVARVNGRPVASLADLRRGLRLAAGGASTWSSSWPGQGAARVVLDAAEAQAAGGAPARAPTGSSGSTRPRPDPSALGRLSPAKE